MNDAQPNARSHQELLDRILTLEAEQARLREALTQAKVDRDQCLRAVVTLVSAVEGADNPYDQGLSSHDDAMVQARRLLASFALTPPVSPTPAPR